MGKNIDGITRTASALTGTERFALRDGVANPAGDLDAKGVVSQLATYMASGVLDTYINNLVATGIATQRRGTIQLWGAAAAPTGALLCTGQAVSRTTYASLYAIIGTTFGVGDNSTTFNVPNFQGVVPKGVGSQTINTRSKSGPSLGALQEDQFQGWQLGSIADDAGARNYYAKIGNRDTQASGAAQTNEGLIRIGTTFQGVASLVKAVSDGTNGTPRTGTTTQENCLGINFIIWY